MPIFRQLLAASLLASVSCNDSVPTLPTSPSVPAPQSYAVSGTVYETVGGISRPVAGRKVDIYISGANPRADVVETDQNGRYTLQVTVFPRTLVFVTGAGLHAAGHQRCLASALVGTDTTIDVEVFPVGSSSTPPEGPGPMVTGVVYETTPQGRNPVRGVWAVLEVGSSFWVAKTQTDEAGRFFFCRVNAEVQMVVNDNEVMSASGYKDGVAYIPGTGDMFFEVELKR
jgi:hypothetical protein